MLALVRHQGGAILGGEQLAHGQLGRSQRPSSRGELPARVVFAAFISSADTFVKAAQATTLVMLVWLVLRLALGW